MNKEFSIVVTIFSNTLCRPKPKMSKGVGLLGRN